LNRLDGVGPPASRPPLDALDERILRSLTGTSINRMGSSSQIPYEESDSNSYKSEEDERDSS